MSIPSGVCRDTQGLYRISDKIYVPRIPKLIDKIIMEFHTTLCHADNQKTSANILRFFYWTTIHKDTKSFIKLCPTCQKIKPKTTKPYGSLMPLPVPSRPWESVSMDFITCLPNVTGFDAVLSAVCTLTKMAHFIPCTSTINAR